jgi:hypothetical protein
MAELESQMAKVEGYILELAPIELKAALELYFRQSRELREQQSVDRLVAGLKAAGVL